jgi:hypothetical protein
MNIQAVAGKAGPSGKIRGWVWPQPVEIWEWVSEGVVLGNESPEPVARNEERWNSNCMN